MADLCDQLVLVVSIARANLIWGAFSFPLTNDSACII